MTLAVTGDAGKTLVLQTNLARFGIVQLARTGTVSLKRGQFLLEVNSTFSSNSTQNTCDEVQGVIAHGAGHRSQHRAAQGFVA